MKGNKPMDGGELFAATLLVAGFFTGAICVLLGVALVLQKAWQHFHGKSECEQEQRQAVAVAQALVIQHQYDTQRRQKLYMTVLSAQAVMIRHFRDRSRDQ
jgi:hypothetical protein